MILQSLMEDIGRFFSRGLCGTHHALQNLPGNASLSVLTSPSRQPLPRPAVPGSPSSSHPHHSPEVLAPAGPVGLSSPPWGSLGVLAVRTRGLTSPLCLHPGCPCWSDSWAAPVTWRVTSLPPWCLWKPSTSHPRSSSTAGSVALPPGLAPDGRLRWGGDEFIHL